LSQESFQGKGIVTIRWQNNGGKQQQEEGCCGKAKMS